MAILTDQIDFIWEGLDKSKVRIKGEISARSELIAKVELTRQGYRVIKIRKKTKALFSIKQKPITSADIALFARQLATMMSSGITIVQALDIISKGHENLSVQLLLSKIKVDVESGDSLNAALKRHPKYFDTLFCNLVESGEQAGVLEGLLAKIAVYKEKTESMKKKIKKALTYPISVMVVAIVVTAILLLFVVPVFEDMFKGFGADLPAFTRMVVDLSKWLQAWWWSVLSLAVIGCYVFIYFNKNSSAFNYFLNRLLLSLPIIGVIIKKSSIARFARTLATMSTAGVPLVEALTSVSGACGNIIYAETVLKMREEVANGQRLQYAMQQSNLWPNMVQQMVAIGEESGAIDAMLSKVADFYEEEVDNLVDNLSSLMEPIIMAVLGVIVGGLIMAMYLPIFKMGAAVG